MKNYIQPGNTITLTAPYDVTSGDGLLVGSIFGVASGAALNGAAVEAALVGVFDLTKVGSQAWSVGDTIYWDNTAKNCTKTTSGNTKIGVAVAAVDNAAGSTIGSVTAERLVLRRWCPYAPSFLLDCHAAARPIALNLAPYRCKQDVCAVEDGIHMHTQSCNRVSRGAAAAPFL